MNAKHISVRNKSKVHITLYVLICSMVATTNVVAVERQKIIMGQLGSGNGQVGARVTNDYDLLPQAIAVDRKGSVYLADHTNDRIVKFRSDGSFSLNIPFRVTEKRYLLTIEDIETDHAGNLYVASRHEGKLSKYDPSGNLLGAIDLNDKNVCWDEEKKWFSCAIQISQIVVDTEGSIYLRGFNELIKLSGKGDVVKKWKLQSGKDFVLDYDASLYISSENVESYDRHGRKRWIKKCGEVISRVDNGNCLLPKWVDHKGNYYWFEKMGSFVRKTDRDGRELGRIDLRPIHLYGNTVKFDIRGNLYFLGATRTEYWLEKVSF